MSQEHSYFYNLKQRLNDTMQTALRSIKSFKNLCRICYQRYADAMNSFNDCVDRFLRLHSELEIF